MEGRRKGKTHVSGEPVRLAAQGRARSPLPSVGAEARALLRERGWGWASGVREENGSDGREEEVGEDAQNR